MYIKKLTHVHFNVLVIIIVVVTVLLAGRITRLVLDPVLLLLMRSEMKRQCCRLILHEISRAAAIVSQKYMYIRRVTTDECNRSFAHRPSFRDCGQSGGSHPPVFH